MAKVDLRDFDYRKVASSDAAMWRAYYNHQFLRLFVQLIQLFRNQLRLNWLITIRLAFYSAWAASDYRLNRKKLKKQRVLKNLVKFYKLISAHSLKPFDYTKTAKLELGWWEAHRSSTNNNPALEQSLASAAGAMYGVSPAQLKDYAHFRAEAMILPAHTADEQSPTDWEKINSLLLKSWQSLYKAVQ